MNISIVEAPVKVTVTDTKVVVVVDYTGTLPTPANPPGWYNALPYYESIEAAVADGLLPGQIFKLNSPSIMGLPRGSIIEVI